MKNLLSLFLSITTVYGFSQPVINSDVMTPEIGDSIQYHGQTVVDFDPGPTGEDVTWDFSGIAGDENSTILFTSGYYCGDLTTHQNLDAEEFTEHIPNLWGQLLLPTTERRFTSTETSFSFCWIGGLEFGMDFDEPFTYFTFPLSYGLENMSLLTGLCNWGIYEIGDPDPFTGSSNMVVDGYGTLVLSTGVYSDVLRVKVIDNIGCGYGEVDSYYWFKEGYKGPLFIYSKENNLGYEDAFVRLNGPEYLGIDETSIDISVYPNPAGNFLIIKGFESAVAEICNLSGQIISTEQISNNQTSLNISSLAKGLYLIKLITNEGTGTSIFEKF